jgi:phage-related protein
MEAEPGKTLYTFYETPTFTAKLAKLVGENALEVLLAIQADLLADPERWPVVKGTGGARKGRIANPASDRGKSGSFRYLYLFVEHRGRIYLLHLFAKANQSDLNADQKKEIADMIEIIKQANQ